MLFRSNSILYGDQAYAACVAVFKKHRKLCASVDDMAQPWYDYLVIVYDLPEKGLSLWTCHGIILRLLEYPATLLLFHPPDCGFSCLM